jgi:hypothetical protein
MNRRGTPDLILATGCVMDGAGVLAARWRRWASSRGGAMGGARRRSLSHATVRHLGWGFFLQGRWGLGNSPGGSSAGGELRSRVCGIEAQASRSSSQRGQAKRVRRKLQITEVELLELEKFLMRRGDERGYLGLASVFLKILARGVIYL